MTRLDYFGDELRTRLADQIGEDAADKVVAIVSEVVVEHEAFDVSTLSDRPGSALLRQRYLMSKGANMSKLDSHGRLSYHAMTEAQRESLCRWFTDHGIDYKAVPIDPDIVVDEAAGTVTVGVYPYVDEATDEVAWETVTVRMRSPLPWPTPGRGT